MKRTAKARQRRQAKPNPDLRRRTRPVLERLEDRTLLANAIVPENQLAGTPESVWGVSGAGDASIQGFATDMSVDQGQTISFKINDAASAAYHIDIYRLGYYGGNGARKVTTIPSTQVLRQVQPNALTNAATGLVDAGNWAVSASWAVPTTATSGLYFARPTRDDTGGASIIWFVVRDDDGASDLLFQTSDTTWQAYNSWGGNSLYEGSPDGRAYKVSYNRPLIIDGRSGGLGDYNSPLHAEYPMIRWLEANGYNVSYSTDVDSDRRGAEIREHKVFLSVGHDEYWSGQQRANVEAARDAGVNLAFFSGNEVFWKTRWENSIDSSGTPYRTLVCYKESKNNAKIDPAPVWTGTWRDSRFSPPYDGGRPENALSGNIYMNDRTNVDLGIPMKVPEVEGKLRFWRNTAVANLAPGQTATLGQYVVGYEVDEDLDNGFRPGGLITMSSTFYTTSSHVTVPWGTEVGPGSSTHKITLYRAPSGALVFGAGTVQWSWGLDGTHKNGTSATDASMRQATVNLFADMGVQPGSLQPGLVAATASTDLTAPTSTITSPAPGTSLQVGTPVTISGTAIESGGGRLAVVEVSTDSGATWRRATGLASWSYTWTPTVSGPTVIKSRAVDDSVNLETPGPGVSVTVATGNTLVAAFGFNEGSGLTVADASGKGNNGTVGGATWTAGGKYGPALSFDGVNDWVTVNDASSLDMSGALTLEAWVNPTALNSWETVMMKEAGTDLAYSLYADNNGNDTGGPRRPIVSIRQGGSTWWTPGTAQVAAGTWTHLAGTYDGSNLKMYVNGTLATSFAITGPVNVSTGALRIGGNNVWGEWFNGLIDEVRIYNRALSQSEIQTDMNTPIGGDPPPPTISINDVSVTEGNSGTVNAVFTVTLSTSSTQTVSVTYATANGTATAGSDYSAIAPTTLTFTPGQTSKTVTVAVLGDTVFEGNETFFVNLTSPINATLADGQGQGTIVEDETPPPTISINDVSVTEGNSGTVNAVFTVTLSASSTQTVTVTYATANGTATAGSDYTAASGTLTIPAGSLTGTIAVVVSGDTVVEADETFFVNLSNPTNATIADSQGRGTITNDEAPPPTLSINDVSVTEGNSGTVNAVFTVTLSASSTQTVTVTYATANGTATAGSDYTAVPPTTLTFTPGQTSKTVTVSVLGDTASEGNETFFVNLSNPANATLADSQGQGTIVDDETVLIGGDGFGYSAFTAPFEAVDLVQGGPGVITIRSNGGNNTNTVTFPAGNTFNFYGSSFTALVVSTNGLITLSSGTNSATNTDLTSSPTQRSIAPLWDDWDDITSSAMILGRYEDTDSNGTNDRLIIEWNVQGAPISPSPLMFQAILKLNTGTVPGEFTFNYSDTDSGDTRADGASATVGIKDAGTQGPNRLLVQFNSTTPYVGSGKAIRFTFTPDTTPPAVSVTTPANSSTVSGTITLSANASDNVGVAGVQFLLDGANLGAEDATAPYSVPWNTTTATNGAHTVTARARDAVGNQTTSTVINVTVSNSGGGTGLVAAYGFNEGSGAAVADASGTGNTGTISGAAWTTTGRYGNALSFDGINDWVTVADAASLDVTTAMTVEAWVNPATINGWETVLMKEATGSYSYGLYADNNGNDVGQPRRPAVFVVQGGSYFGTQGASQLAVSTWTHLAATYDGGVLRLYVNGVLAGSLNQTGSIDISSGPLRIGGNSNWGEWFNGLIDEVRVYSRALSATEIQSDMNTPIGSPERLMGEAVAGADVTPVSQQQIQPLFDQSVRRWAATIADPVVVKQLQTVRVDVMDLPGTTLGLASGAVIFIDVNGAGHGWFVDSTPWDDSEFAPDLADSPAAGRVDLLTVLAHEMGHIVGLDDDSSADPFTGNVMADVLPLGERRIHLPGLDSPPPVPADADGLRVAAFHGDARIAMSLTAVPVIESSSAQRGPVLSALGDGAPERATPSMARLPELLPTEDVAHGLLALVEPRTVIADRKDLDLLIAELGEPNPFDWTAGSRS